MVPDYDESLNDNNINNQDQMGRNKRKTLTEETLRSIRRGMDLEQSPKEIANNVDISLCSIYKILKKITDNKSNAKICFVKKGKKNFNERIKNKLTQVLLRDHSQVQKELTNELLGESIRRSQSTMSRVLKEMNYSRKRHLESQKNATVFGTLKLVKSTLV
ncbi:hypothetical protein CDIK_3096 [Cucumispora dikerogammari]|nr:hypothetical protein CDIK_3096 [Cucumispora dikerogammari]